MIDRIANVGIMMAGLVRGVILDRRLVTILAIDVAGYSRLMRVDEEGTLAALISMRSLIDERVSVGGTRVRSVPH